MFSAGETPEHNRVDLQQVACCQIDAVTGEDVRVAHAGGPTGLAFAIELTRLQHVCAAFPADAEELFGADPNRTDHGGSIFPDGSVLNTNPLLSLCSKQDS